MRLMLVRVPVIVIPSGEEGWIFISELFVEGEEEIAVCENLAFRRDDTDATLPHVSKILGRHLGVDHLFLRGRSHRADRPHHWQTFCNPIAGAWAARHGLHERAGGNTSWPRNFETWRKRH